MIPSRLLSPACLAIFLLAVDASAQRRGGAGRGESPQSTLTVHGSVMLPDNVVPHRIVRLQQVCGGKASGLAFADSKGHYSYDLGIVFNPMTGTAVAGGKTSANYADCLVRASLEGFRSEPVAVMPVLRSRQTELPVILLKPVAKDESALLSATDGVAGEEAKKDYARGLDLVSQGKWREAIRAMQKAVAEEPKFATAWLSLGMVQVSQKDLAGARKSFAAAIAADGKFAAPYIELAVLEASDVEGAAPQWDRVVEHSGQAISLDADSFPRAFYLNAMANLRLRRTAAALKSSAEGVRVDQNHEFPDLQYMQGLLLLNAGDRVHGRKLLQDYLEIAPDGDNAENARTQLKTAGGN